MNQESSPNCLAFQVANTTISPNYPGEEFETLDRQILVISADVPPQDGETDEQQQERENTNAARAVQRQQELAVASPGAGQPPANAGQVNTNVGQQAPAAPAAHSSDAKIIYLVPIDCVHEISSGISSVTDSKFTIHRKPTWEPSLPL
jgi:type II secretory pathway pseudopilin PulG